MDWLGLALLTPVLWSIVVLIDDNLVRGIYKNPFTGAVISGLFGSLPLVSLVWLDAVEIAPKVAAAGLASGFLTVMYYFYYFKALEREAPSVVVALFSLTPATLPFLAYLLLDERLSVMQLVGFMVVLLFTLMLAVVDVKKFKFSKALAPVFVAVVLMDLVLICEKYVYQHISFYTGFMYFSAGMALASVVMFSAALYKAKAAKKPLVLLTKKQYVVAALLFLSLTESINIAAEFTSNLAVSKGPVSLVEVLQNTQPMYMLIISLLLFPFFPKYFREAGQGRIGYKFVMMLGILAGVAITVSSSV